MERLDTITVFDGPRGDHEFTFADGSLRIDEKTARITVPTGDAPNHGVTGWEILASVGDPPNSRILYAGEIVKEYTRTESTGEVHVYKCEPAHEFRA